MLNAVKHDLVLYFLNSGISLSYDTNAKRDVQALQQANLLTLALHTLIEVAEQALQLGVNEIAQRLRISKVTLYKYLRLTQAIPTPPPCWPP